MKFHESGNEILYNGMSGEQLESSIFIGPTYYLRLKHMVKDKINFRERGPMTMITRQPVQGRANDGGLRIGEMERDGLIANGLSAFVQESMMIRGDGTYMDRTTKTRKPYCIYVDNTTGLITIYNKKTNTLISPTLDGPLQYTQGELSTVSKFKKSFSVLNVPYSFKLLIQELACMNVQMRFVTTDNISSLESLKSIQIPVNTLNTFFEFSKLATILPHFIDTTLYSSTTNDSCIQIIFHHKHLSDTIFPVLVTSNEYRRLRLSMSNINPIKRYTPQYNREKWNMPVYQNITPSSLSTTLNYFTEKMKTGIFVRIKNNRLFNFLPLYNVEYENTFYELFKIGKVTYKSPEFASELNAMLSKLEHSKNFYNRDVTKWHATNCLLRNESEDQDPTTQYIAEMYDMLVQTCSHRVVNDCIFFINRKDFPHLNGNWKETFTAIYGDTNMKSEWSNKPYFPILSQSTTIHHADLPIPTGDDWNSITQQYFTNFLQRKIVCKNDNLDIPVPSWEKRQFKVIWRGQGTGCGNTPETNPRMHLDSLDIPGLDAHITKYTYRIKAHREDDYAVIEPPLSISKEKLARLKEFFMPMKDQVQFKFILNIEGNSAAYRYGSLFKYGFCVFNVDSIYTLWFEPMLRGDYVQDGMDTSNFHFLKIKHDLSNLKETIEWCQHHDAECKQIAENGVKFYHQYFNREFVYDYMSDILNGVSSIIPSIPDEDYALLKSEKPKTPIKVKSFTQTHSDINTSVIIIPFRDTKDQNRTEQLQSFIANPVYKDKHILVVEQLPGQKFNRGLLLNIGYHFITTHVPSIQTFVMHDVDITFPDDFVRAYYGTDDKEIVHLGNAVASDKYKDSDTFMGRVVKFSKESYKAINGFPNTFYGWGGEDDALVYRINEAKYTVFRPKESKVGLEMKTENDILESKDNDRKEMSKVENLIADTFQWQMDGVNSIQYKVVNHERLQPNIRKITVQFAPTTKFKPVISEKIDKTIEREDIVEGGSNFEVIDLDTQLLSSEDSLSTEKESEKKTISINHDLE
jgi:hypothetical protein